MKIAMSKTREQFPLSEKKPLKKTTYYIISSIGILILLLVGGFALTSFLNWSFEKEFLPIVIFWCIFSIVGNFLMYFYQIWYFQVYFYDLTDDFIIIRKRVITPREITIPYERVQDVYVTRTC